MTRARRRALIAAGLGVTLLAMAALPVSARGGRHSAAFAGGRRHGNDSYIKSASDQRDKLLNTRIKSICRGC